MRGLHEVPERCRAWAETEARRFESQFVHEEHDEDLHSKGAGLCPRPCLTGQRHLHLLLPRRLELKVCAPPALAWGMYGVLHVVYCMVYCMVCACYACTDAPLYTWSYAAGPLPEPLLEDERLQAAVQICFGEADPWTPPARVRALERFRSVRTAWWAYLGSATARMTRRRSSSTL